MSDIDQGSDNELFRGAIDTTLEKFENPELPKEDPKPEPKPEPKPDPEKVEPQDREAIPAWRLREATERARAAEAERDDYRARMAAYERQHQTTQKPAPDIFENPSGFVRAEMEQGIRPMIEQLQERFQLSQEAMSRNFAVAQHGADTVQSAYVAMGQSLRMGDAHAKAVYDQAMRGFDPYGDIMRWHRERETLSQTGGDLEAFKKKVREEALDDPDYQRLVIERAQTRAKSNGNTVNRPPPKVPTMPSLANFGAGGGDEAIIEPSDEQLFRQAVTAKRR